MDMALKYGKMTQLIKDNIHMGKNREKVNLNGQMDLAFKGNFMIIIFKVMALTSGVMEEYIMVHGLPIKCMVRVFLHGLMAKFTKDNI